LVLKVNLLLPHLITLPASCHGFKKCKLSAGYNYATEVFAKLYPFLTSVIFGLLRGAMFCFAIQLQKER
jgi:hypothetical protein